MFDDLHMLKDILVGLIPAILAIIAAIANKEFRNFVKKHTFICTTICIIVCVVFFYTPKDNWRNDRNNDPIEIGRHYLQWDESIEMPQYSVTLGKTYDNELRKSYNYIISGIPTYLINFTIEFSEPINDVTVWFRQEWYSASISAEELIDAPQMFSQGIYYIDFYHGNDIDEALYIGSNKVNITSGGVYKLIIQQ